MTNILGDKRLTKFNYKLKGEDDLILSKYSKKSDSKINDESYSLDIELDIDDIVFLDNPEKISAKYLRNSYNNLYAASLPVLNSWLKKTVDEIGNGNKNVSNSIDKILKMAKHGIILDTYKENQLKISHLGGESQREYWRLLSGCTITNNYMQITDLIKYMSGFTEVLFGTKDIHMIPNNFSCLTMKNKPLLVGWKFIKNGAYTILQKQSTASIYFEEDKDSLYYPLLFKKGVSK